MGWATTYGTVRRGLSEPLFTVPNVTVHPSRTSVQIIVLLYNGPFLQAFVCSLTYVINDV